MNKRISKIIEVCGYEEDPCWPVLKEMMNHVSFENPQRILMKKNRVIRSELLKARKRTYVRVFRKQVIDIAQLLGVAKPYKGGILFYNPVFFAGGVSLPHERLFISRCRPGVHIGGGTFLLDVMIDAPTYIDADVDLEYSRIQGPDRFCFIGRGATASNVIEMRGCFISGSQDMSGSRGRKETYIHATGINNMIIGAGTGMAAGTNVHNHPQDGIPPAMYDLGKFPPKTKYYPLGKKHRKLPIFVGISAVIGLNCSIHSGSVVGAHALIPGNTEIAGLAIMTDGETVYREFAGNAPFQKT